MLAWFRRFLKKDPPHTAVESGDMGMEEVSRILRDYRREIRREAECCAYLYEISLEEQYYVDELKGYEVYRQ